MTRIFLSKLLLPNTAHGVDRPRLTGIRPVRLLAALGPSGCGKTTFLSRWLQQQGTDSLYYRLDQQDRDGSAFAAHLATGFRRLWPDWAPPAGVADDPVALAAELVNAAVSRPPVALALDRLEEAYEQGYLTDVLSLLLEYAPPNWVLAVGTRVPLPAEVSRAAAPVHYVTAADLAFTYEEAAAWLGPGDWASCHQAAAGYPLALALWQQKGEGWRAALAEHLLVQRPPHLSPEVGRALVESWLSGQLSLSAFAHQVSQGQTGAEQLRADLRAVRQLLLSGELAAARDRLGPLWERVRAGQDAPLAGAVALLFGEWHFCRGEYALAMERYRAAFHLDSALETTGNHNVVSILRDQGHLEEAEALGRRCLEALEPRADLLALSSAHYVYASVCSEQGRPTEAGEHFRAAQHLGLELAGEPFYGILAASQRALLYAREGQFAEYRRLAEEALAMARRRSPWLEVICGYSLAPGMAAWGERERCLQLLAGARQFLTAIEAKWQLHMVLLIEARATWDSDRDQARARLDAALSLAAAESYVQQLPGPGDWLLPLMLDALARGHEVPFCQELLIRMGPRALPALLELTQSPSPGARGAALYPLTAIGGEAAARAIAGLLSDSDETVSDRAVVALRALGQTDAPPPSPRAEAPAAALSVSILGPMAVSCRGQAVSGWRTAKARDLLAYLIISGERPVTRSQLVDALWPEADAEAGQAVLHTTLYHLRRTLKPVGEEVISFSGGAYRLNRSLIAVDLDRFLALAGAGTEEAWRGAADLYQGTALEGLEYPWCEPIRARVQALYVGVLQHLSRHLRESGRPGEATQQLQLMVQADPLSEEAHLALMECYAETGNRHAALQQYRTLTALLDEELGLEPGTQARALYRRLLD